MAKEGEEERMVEYEFEPDTKEEVMQVLCSDCRCYDPNHTGQSPC